MYDIKRKTNKMDRTKCSQCGAVGILVIVDVYLLITAFN